jgi:hypothetical protein
LQRLSVVRCNGCLLFVATAVCCSLQRLLFIRYKKRLSFIRCTGCLLFVATAVVFPLQRMSFTRCRHASSAQCASAARGAGRASIHPPLQRLSVVGCMQPCEIVAECTVATYCTYKLHGCNIQYLQTARLQHAVVTNARIGCNMLRFVATCSQHVATCFAQ